jgi:hypothetical protein
MPVTSGVRLCCRTGGQGADRMEANKPQSRERPARVVPGSAHPAAAGRCAPGGRPVSGGG